LIGASPKRKEDDALLVGQGRYLDDLARPGMLHMGLIRSMHAHARIRCVSGAAAAALPGVVGVFRPDDLPELRGPIPPYRRPRKFRDFDQPVLAAAVVRYVGEPIAVVLAETRPQLADALDKVEVDYEPLPVAATTEDMGNTLFAHWPNNLAYVNTSQVGDPAAVLGNADLVVQERFRHARSAGTPLEPRGVLAYVEDTSGMLVVVTSTQVTYHVREALAEVLDIPEERIRVLAPDVGGAFGAKAQVQHEEMLAPALALKLKRPVKWVESRHEHFLCTCHDREQVHEVKVGFRRDGTIVAIEDEFWADFGAYPVQEDAVTLNTINHLCSPYKVAHYRSVCNNVVTNKMFAAAYRGAGRPEAALVMDRVMDLAARKLKLDPSEIRRRNLIQPAEMPYRPGLTYKDGVPIKYDPADLPAAWNRLLQLFRYDEWRGLQRERKRGAVKRIGIGLSCYLHGSALGPYEGANVRVDPGGKVYVYVGCNSQGQGHATTLAQICAQELGVPLADVVVVGADTAVLAYGVGAMASRIAANAGPAVGRAAREVRTKAQKVAATMLEAAPEDVRIADGKVHVVGMPDRHLRLADVARAAVKSKSLLKHGPADPGLNACSYFSPESVTWAFGAQAAAVEVDTETCEYKILNYAAIHDCGQPINPMIVEGQMHGAIAQGLGGAMMEQMVYDRAGQLLTGSFMDYAMPKADDFPFFVTALVNHRSIVNDLGIKGAGESGTISPSAVIANAVDDALHEFGVTIREVPVTPAKIFELLREAEAKR
jgi:carbon-monoxide dehydrogenase large subunit